MFLGALVSLILSTMIMMPFVLLTYQEIDLRYADRATIERLVEVHRAIMYVVVAYFYQIHYCLIQRPQTKKSKQNNDKQNK